MAICLKFEVKDEGEIEEVAEQIWSIKSNKLIKNIAIFSGLDLSLNQFVNPEPDYILVTLNTDDSNARLPVMTEISEVLASSIKVDLVIVYSETIILTINPSGGG